MIRMWTLLICLYVSFLQTDSQSATKPSFCKAKEASCIIESFGYSPSCVISALSSCEEQPLLSSIEAEIKKLIDKIDSMMKQGQRIGQNQGATDRPRNCQDLMNAGDTTSGIRKVYPHINSPEYPQEVFCDQTTDGGGWTVIQKRTDEAQTRTNFERQWLEYVVGFGDLNGEFWLGLNVIHALTSNTMMELRLDLEDFEAARRWAKYGTFLVGDKHSKYELNIGDYSGSAGDAFSGTEQHHKAMFSTEDNDNDSNKENCAHNHRSGWWFTNCVFVNLNGIPYVRTPAQEWEGILYEPWKGSNYSLKRAKMMIRPKFNRQHI